MEYKTISGLWHPSRKLSKVRRVRERKRCMTEQTSDFESHYAVRHSSLSYCQNNNDISLCRARYNHRVRGSGKNWRWRPGMIDR